MIIKDTLKINTIITLLINQDRIIEHFKMNKLNINVNKIGIFIVIIIIKMEKTHNKTDLENLILMNITFY